MINKILVATDGSGHARKAIEYACDLALRYEATVYLLHVIHKSGVPESLLKIIEAHRREERPEEVILQESVSHKVCHLADRTCMTVK